MKVKHWMTGDVREMTTDEIISYEVSEANSEQGALEDAEARIEKLSQILGAVALQLTVE